MKPAKFSYERPQQLEDVFKLLETYADDAKIIAGGQSLVPMMNMRLARPSHLIDINHLEELSYIRRVKDDIEIGALTRQHEMEESSLFKDLCPIIPYAVSKIGHYSIRQRGTVGGSLVHADPSGELPVMATLLDAVFHIGSSEGMRISTAEEFFVTIYTTDLMPTELVTSIKFPILIKGEGWSYQEFSRRAGDYAMVSAGSTVQLNELGKVEKIRLVIGGSEMIPYHPRDLLASFTGVKPDEKWMKSLTDEIISQLEPSSDIHASAEDRLELLQILIPKSLQESLRRAGQRGEI